MIKTKVMMTGFAIFAAVLMLMTTCMARPIQEKASIESVEFAEKELMNSFEALNVKLSRDAKSHVLLDAIARAPDVARIVNRMETARSEEEIITGVEQLINVLQDSSEFEQLVNLIEGDYSAESEAIAEQLEAMTVDITGDVGNLQTSGILITILKWIMEWIGTLIYIIIYNILDFFQWLLEWLFGDGDEGGTTT